MVVMEGKHYRLAASALGGALAKLGVLGDFLNTLELTAAAKRSVANL